MKRANEILSKIKRRNTLLSFLLFVILKAFLN